MFPTPKLRPPSRHRPRRPPKTASGVTRTRKPRKGQGLGLNGRNLDLEYRQRPSTAGGLGGKDFGGNLMLQITPMFRDKASRAAVGDSVFNFEKLAEGDLQQAATGGGRRRGGRGAGGRGGAGGGARGNSGPGSLGQQRRKQAQRRQHAGGSAGAGGGHSPRLSRGQVGQGMGRRMNQQQFGGGGGGGGGMMPQAPGGTGGGRAGVSPRQQRIRKN